MAQARRPLCAELSAGIGEPLAATASHVERWLLLEYRGLWSPDPLPGSMLDPAVKRHLAAQLAERPRTRLLFLRRPRHEHSGVVCYTAETPEAGGTLHRLVLAHHEELVGLDLFGGDRGEPVETPLLAVCTHGKRDRCCARYGRPLYDAVCDQLDPGVAEGDPVSRPGVGGFAADASSPDWVWQCTHVGGDRFAGNLVCFPEGLYFGRVGLGDVWPLLDDYLSGRIYLGCYRGRCAYPFPAQAAERALRERLGLLGIDDLRLEAVERAGAGWRVAFETGGERHELEVEEARGEPAYLTCDAERLQRPRRFVVTKSSPSP